MEERKRKGSEAPMGTLKRRGKSEWEKIMAWPKSGLCFMRDSSNKKSQKKVSISCQANNVSE